MGELSNQYIASTTSLLADAIAASMAGRASAPSRSRVMVSRSAIRTERECATSVREMDTTRHPSHHPTHRVKLLWLRVASFSHPGPSCILWSMRGPIDLSPLALLRVAWGSATTGPVALALRGAGTPT